MAIVRSSAGNVVVDPLRRGHVEQYSYGNDYFSLVGDTIASYFQLYKSQPYLAAAVNKIARGASRLPVKAYRRTGEEGDRDRLRDHPLADLMVRPRPKMSKIRWLEWIFSDVALYGNSVSFITQSDSGEPDGIFPVPFPMVQIVGRRDPETYIYQSPTGPIAFDADRVFHLRFRGFDPTRQFVSVSPCEPLRNTLINEDAASRWSTSLFKNSGRPSGFFVTEKNLNEQQAAALRTQAQTIHGGVENAGKMGVLSGGLTWEQTQMNVVETGLIDLRRLNREEVAAAYDIPPPLLQDLSKATFSNITEQHRMFYTGTLPPWLTLFEEEFQAQVIDLTAAWGSDLFVEFDMNEVLKGDPKERAETYAIARRYMTVDEIRQRENLPALDIPGKTDTVWEPINEVPLGVSMQPALPNADNPALPAPKSALAEALERAERIGISRLGRGSAPFDPDRFTRELLAAIGDHEEAKRWASELSLTLEDVLRDASSVTELRERMAVLRGLPSGEPTYLEPAQKMPEMAAPVHVHMPEVKVTLPERLELAAEPPIINVQVNVPEQEAPSVTVPEPKARVRKIIRDADSNIIEIREEEDTA